MICRVDSYLVLVKSSISKLHSKAPHYDVSYQRQDVPDKLSIRIPACGDSPS